MDKRPTNGARPAGSMCTACQHRARDCSHLDFAQMPVMRFDRLDGMAVVWCTGFAREAK